MDKERFTDFKEDILCLVSDMLISEAKCSLTTTRKNNGLLLNGINVTPNENKIGTIIYIDGFFEDYNNGSSRWEIAERICEIYRTNKDRVDFDIKDFESFETASARIAYKLINYDANKAFLELVPHRRVLDLAVIYYYLTDIAGDAMASAVIKNEHLDMWQTDEKTLYKIARANTPQLLPKRLQSMQEVLNGVIPFEYGVGDKCLDIMYVLTNDKGINGATCMVYPHVLSEFANRIQEDLYILPSSIHEIIIVPKTMISNVADIRNLVSFINDTEVSEDEVLSDTVYYFERHSGMIEVA